LRRGGGPADVAALMVGRDRELSRTIENFRVVSAKHNPPQDIDGLLTWSGGRPSSSSPRSRSLPCPASRRARNSPSTKPRSSTSA